MEKNYQILVKELEEEKRIKAEVLAALDVLIESVEG